MVEKATVVGCIAGAVSSAFLVWVTQAAPPECEEGDRKCAGYDLYKCIGGKWALIEANSPECGYVPEVRVKDFRLNKVGVSIIP